MTTRFWLPLVGCLIASLSIAAPVPKNKKGNPEEAIQGTWEVVDFDFGNRVAGAAKPRGPIGLHWTLDGDKLSMKQPNAVAGGNTATFKIDTTQTPMQFEWNYNGNPTAIRAIFEIDGDTLKICYSGQRRPTELVAGNGTYMYTFKRVAK